MRCRSEPQIAQAVILMIASRPSSIVGSGTLSQRMSPLPCQQSAFIIFSPLYVSKRSSVTSNTALGQRTRLRQSRSLGGYPT